MSVGKIEDGLFKGKNIYEKIENGKELLYIKENNEVIINENIINFSYFDTSMLSSQEAFDLGTGIGFGGFFGAGLALMSAKGQSRFSIVWKNKEESTIILYGDNGKKFVDLLKNDMQFMNTFAGQNVIPIYEKAYREDDISEEGLETLNLAIMSGRFDGEQIGSLAQACLIEHKYNKLNLNVPKIINMANALRITGEITQEKVDLIQKLADEGIEGPLLLQALIDKGKK